MRRNNPVHGITYAALAAVLLFTSQVAHSAKPDFSGTWERYPDPYAAFTDSPFAEDPPPPGDGPPLKEPYAKEFKELAARRLAAAREGKLVADASTQCRPEGMPTIMAGVYPLEIVQTPKQLVVLAEFLTQTRRIYLNEKMPPQDEILPGYNGYSIGHWEGNTLVVKTIGVREDVKFLGIPHSDQMKVTERFRLTAANMMDIDISIDDPAFLVKPYTFTFGFRRNPDYRIMEYICDNNYYRTNDQGGVSLDIAPAATK